MLVLITLMLGTDNIILFFLMLVLITLMLGIDNIILIF